MTVFNLYSKRQKKLRGEVPDFLTYDNIPENLRVRIVHIIRDAIGVDKYGDNANIIEVYEYIHKTLCREYGLFRLNKYDNYEDAVLNFLLTTPDYDKVIDVIELFFKYIDKIIKPDFKNYSYNVNPAIRPDAAIEELNERFKEEGIGYAFENGEIIRIDSTYVHSEVVKPSLSLLNNNKFLGANEEYLKAHEHYRLGRNKECLTECLKAFESVMKVICSEKGWAFNQTDTAKKLIQVCFQNGLVPTLTQNQFSSLQNLLESGIPTIRNKLGGHGQGQIPQKVDNEITRYALNLTGTNVIFLIEQSGIK